MEELLAIFCDVDDFCKDYAEYCIKTVFSPTGQLQSFCGNYENVNSSINIIPHEIPCWQVYRNKFYRFDNT